MRARAHFLEPMPPQAAVPVAGAIAALPRVGNVLPVVPAASTPLPTPPPPNAVRLNAERRRRRTRQQQRRRRTVRRR